MSSSIAKLHIRPLPHQTLISGYPSIPTTTTSSRNRPPAEIQGIVELRPSNQQIIQAAYLTIELILIQSRTSNPKNTIKTTIHSKPTILWTASPNDPHLVLPPPSSSSSSKKLSKQQTKQPDNNLAASINSARSTANNTEISWATLSSSDFKFTIPLPDSLPPSIIIDSKTRSGISYLLKATLCARSTKPESYNTWFKRSSNSPSLTTTTLELEIPRYELLPAWPIYQRPASESTSLLGLSIKITNDRSAIGPGDQIKSKIEIESSNIHPIKLIKFELNLTEKVISRSNPLTAEDNNKDVQPAEQKITHISTLQAKINHHVFQKDKLSFDMHIGLPHNHLKLTVSTASHLSIEYYLSLKAYFESPRKHFAKTNKEIPTQLTIEKLPVIVGDRNLAQAQLAVDQIGPVPHLSHPTNDLSSPPPSPSALLQNAIPPQPPSQQQRSSSYGAQDWKHSQWAQNHPRSQLPPRTSLQTLPKVLADPTHHHQQNLRRSFQGQLPYAIPLGLSQPGRPHKFSSSSNPFTGLPGNVPPLPTRHLTTSLQAQSPPIRSPLKEIFLQPTCAPELSPTSQDFYPSSELQTPTRQPSYPHHPTQLVRSLSSPNSEIPHQSSSSSHPTNIHPTSFGSGDEKARLFARAKAEAAMNQARLHHATFSSLSPPHLGSAEPAAGEGSSSHYNNPTYHPTNRELESQMPRSSIQNYHPLDTRFKSLTNLAIHEEGLSEVATIATLPQYHPSSNHSDHHLIQSDQDHHPRRFSSSRLYDLPPPNLSSSQEMDRRSSSPPPPPVNLRTRPSIVNGKSRAEGLIEHDRLNLSSSSSCPIDPRVSRSVRPAVIESPPPTLIDPQREAYLKAVAERERFFMNSTHDDASYRHDDHFRAYEVETNLPTHVLSALEEKNRLRNLWMASLDPSSNPAPPPFHYPSHSLSPILTSSRFIKRPRMDSMSVMLHKLFNRCPMMMMMMMMTPSNSRMTTQDNNNHKKQKKKKGATNRLKMIVQPLHR
ncbi:hypothetical protein PGT21_015237 [Puccinia graminis f. sp. tritici]|uniref:Arrestin C-terminal-like domain-containing protein n=1 Tax=Puccinia graminis f. sp. tritici TaxID=56615 RepID=A0A5B0LVI4_PUCGR|nr:hypothetical protein PGT21_015237 [Puccinia graminis f. sp. tritici]KAA1093539.1 hypothetical protein PGTUg99_026284 [Puccinia graminis f. sp. tritici]